jgi:hypothetical protein
MSPEHSFYTVPLRLRSIFRRGKVERELDEELRYHLEMKIEENAAKGMTGEEARRSALLALGGLDLRKEECRDARGLRWFADMRRNFRYAFRRMIQSPLSTLVILSSLGLGIGANTAIFSVIYQILLRPLPADNPQELALGTTPGAIKGGGGNLGSRTNMYMFSYLQLRELERQQQRDLAELAGVVSPGIGITGLNSVVYENRTTSGSVLAVSGGYFPLMRVQPLLGRTLIPADDQGAGSPVAMLGYAFWKNNMGGRTNVLNQPIRIGKHVFTIIGVVPEGFYEPINDLSPDVIIPLATAVSLSSKMNRMISQLGLESHFSWIFLIARINPGVTPEQVAENYAGTYAATVEEQIQAGKARGLEQHYRKGRLKFVECSRASMVSIIQFKVDGKPRYSS